MTNAWTSGHGVKPFLDGEQRGGQLETGQEWLCRSICAGLCHCGAVLVAHDPRFVRTGEQWEGVTGQQGRVLTTAATGGEGGMVRG